MLILVRHGRTAANAQGRLQGRLDLPLDEVGVRQATAVAAALAVVGPLCRVISSPLVRARQTAAALVAGTAQSSGGHLGIEVDDRWLELDYGILDGVSVKDIDAAIWQQWRSDPDFTVEGGESMGNLDRRVRTACEELRAAVARPGLTVVVSHVSPIKSAVAWALGAPLASSWRMHLDQASISRIDLGERGPVLRSFNEVSHLSGR